MERKSQSVAVFLGLAIMIGLAILSFRTIDQPIPLCLVVFGLVVGTVALVGSLSQKPAQGPWRLDDPDPRRPCGHPAILPMNLPRKPG